MDKPIDSRLASGILCLCRLGGSGLGYKLVDVSDASIAYAKGESV